MAENRRARSRAYENGEGTSSNATKPAAATGPRPIGSERIGLAALYSAVKRQRLDPVQVDRKQQVAQLQGKELGLAWVPLGRRVRAVLER